jgi:hypothetical protein
MPHEDGPLYTPEFAIVSLLGHSTLTLTLTLPALLEFTPKEPNPNPTPNPTPNPEAVLLERRSVLIVTDALYTQYLHGIAFRSEDPLPTLMNEALLDPNTHPNPLPRPPRRLSFTVRRVPRMLKGLPSLRFH